MPERPSLFRVFVSSTFSDFVDERNALHAQVFPRLHGLCEAQETRFQAVDLRWGVSSWAGRYQQTMRICLSEIAKCQALTRRPNFIALLGDRYGWHPPPGEIDAVEFERLLHALPRTSAGKRRRDVLSEWYRRDDNALQPVYCLQPRKARVSNDAVWSGIENDLRSALREAATRTGLGRSARIKYWASATAQEVAAGVFRSTNAHESAFCFMRTITDLPHDAQAGDFTDAAGRAGLKSLKNRLRRKIPGNIDEFTTRWSGNRPEPDHLDEFCERVYARLSGAILAELDSTAKRTPLQHEIESHAEFGKDRMRGFMARESQVKGVMRYLKSANERALEVAGTSGSGKSALMARCVDLTATSHRGATIIVRFAGATAGSSSSRSLLESLCQQIYNEFDLEIRKQQALAAVRGTGREADERTAGIEAEYSIAEDPIQLPATLRRFLSLIPAERHLILFLDALDQLETGAAEALNWFPPVLPKHIRVVVSLTADSGDAASTEQQRLFVPPMTTEDGGRLLDSWLAEAGRRLAKNQRSAVIRAFARNGLPLYLRLAYEEARQWTSRTPAHRLPADITGIIQRLFERLSADENHGETLVSRSFGYLASARVGLSEDELIGVLSSDREVMADFRRRSPKSPRTATLPPIAWSRLYFEVAPYLSERSGDGARLLGFFHRQLTEAAEAKFLTGSSGKARHRTLADYFERQPAELKHDGIAADNARKAGELPFQQARAGLSRRYATTLTDFDFISLKVRTAGPRALLEDYGFLDAAGVLDRKTRAVLDEIEGALRLAAPAISTSESELPAQLLGRLLGCRSGATKQFLMQIQERYRGVWLQPVVRTLVPPGGPLIRTMTGHTGHIRSVALDASGKLVVSGAEDGTVRVWDLDSGSEVRILNESSSVRGVALHPNGRQILCVRRNAFRVWDPDRAVVRMTLLDGDGDLLEAVAYSSDPRYALTLGFDTIDVWDLKNPGTRREIVRLGNRIWKFVASPRAQLVAGIVNDGTVRVWDIVTAIERARLQAGKVKISAGTFTPDGNRIVAIGEDKQLYVWDIRTSKLIRTLQGDKDTFPTVAMAVTPDSRHAVCGSSTGVVQIRDLLGKEPIRTVLAHENRVEGLAITPDGRRLITASQDHTLRVWDLKRRAPPRDATRSHLGTVMQIAMSPDGKRAVTGSGDQTLGVWNLETGAREGTLTGTNAWIQAVAMFPDGKRVASVASDGRLRIWDIESGQVIRRLSLDQNPIDESHHAVAITSDGRRVVETYHADGGQDHAYGAIMWDPDTGQRIRMTVDEYSSNSIDTHAYYRGLALAPNGEFAISAHGYNSRFSVWQINDPKKGMRLDNNGPTIGAISILNDSRRALMGDSSGVLKVWDIPSGTVLQRFKAHASSIKDLALPSDESLVVTSSTDGKVKLWDIASERCLASFTGDSGMRSCAISPDGRTVVAGEESGTVHVLSVHNVTHAARALGRAAETT